MANGGVRLSMQVVVALIVAAVAATWAVTGFMATEAGDAEQKASAGDKLLRDELRQVVDLQMRNCMDALDLHAESIHMKSISRERFDEFMIRFDDLRTDVKDVQKRFGRIEAGIDLLLKQEGID